MKKKLLLPFMLLLMAAAPPPQALEQARTASKALLGELQTTLKSTLSSKGAPEAVKVCSQVAPSIAKNVAKKHHLQIRRVALKHRNPANKPDAYEQKWLTQWQKSPSNIPAEHAEIVTHQGKSTLRYLKPIKIQSACLQCHGAPAQIKPEVKALLKQHYPSDQATGYKEGDLRGAVTVILPLH